MNLKAVIYVRVSTEEQDLKDLSLPFQIAICTAYAERQGYEVTAVYKDICSAKTDKREYFQKLIADAKASLFDFVIVYKYSRFARSDIDSMMYERELNRRAIELVSATEPMDSTTSSGWLGKRILQTFAEFDNRQKADFVKAGMKQKLLKGEWAWKAPVGYINKREGIDRRHRKTWVEVDPTTAPLVIRLFEEAATGHSTLYGLCDMAEELGLKTVRGKGFTPQKMSEMLRNPFYKGKVVSLKFDIEVDGKHEKLVDDNLFDRVQLKLAVRSRSPYCNHRPKHVLRGLTRCSCGMAMTSEFHDNGTNSYLRCVSNANKRYKACGQNGPRIDAVIAQIETEILPMLAISASEIATIHEELKGLMNHDYHVLEAEAQLLREQLVKSDNRAKTLLNVRLDGEITKDEYRVKKGELDIDKAKLSHRLELNNIVLSKCDEDLDQALSIASSVEDLWYKADDEEKHKLLETIFVKFVIDNKKITDTEFKMPYNWLVRWKSDSAKIKK